jgi:hypothetical protein
MNRFFAPKFEDDDLSLKEWVLYVYLLSMTYYKDSDNGKVRRGQALFGTKDLEPMIPKTTATRLRDSLAKKGLIIVDKFTKFPNSKNLITLCKYDEINVKSGQQWAALVGQERAALDAVITDESQKNEKQWSVDKLLSGRSIELTELTSFTIVKDIVSDKSATPSSKPKRTREKKEKAPAITTAIYAAYREAIKKRHTIELSAQGGADVRRILKELVVEYGEEKAIAMVRAYVELKDEFLEKNKHHIKFIGSKTNVVIGHAASTKPEEEVPMKWCQYREKMVPMTKQRINGKTIWE